jgi:hypothetical protein
LVRTSLESAARSAFLLDPVIDQRERVRRWINERLDSLMEGTRLVQDIDGDDAAAEAAKQLEQMRDLQPDKRGWIPTPYLGLKRPSTQAVIELLESQSDGTGKTMHRWMSGMIHGADHGLMSLALVDEAKDGTGPGMAAVPVGVSALKLATWLAPAITAAETTAQRLVAAQGRDRSEWDAVAQPVLRQFRDWMRQYAVG